LRLKILKKLRTASLNSEFTGSYKKKYTKTSYQALRQKIVLKSWGYGGRAPSSWMPMGRAASRPSKPLLPEMKLEGPLRQIF